MPWNRLRTATAGAVVLATLAVSTPLAGQRLIERSVTIRQGETLLVGAIDLTQFPLDDPARSFYLVKHQERYWPFENEIVPIQKVTGFGDNKWFFFVKVDSWDANAAKHTLTLSLKSPVGLMEDMFTLPLLTQSQARAHP